MVKVKNAKQKKNEPSRMVIKCWIACARQGDAAEGRRQGWVSLDKGISEAYRNLTPGAAACSKDRTDS